MSAIIGMYERQRNFEEQKEKWIPLMKELRDTMKRRGSKEEKILSFQNCALSARSLSVLNESRSAIEELHVGSRRYGIVFDGNLYNQKELAREISLKGLDTSGFSIGQLLIAGYIVFGLNFFDKINGAFAGAIYDENEKSLLLFRDPFGIKPLFYGWIQDMFLFASEPKALLSHPDLEAVLDLNGLQEIFAIGPARTPGNGIFKGIKEVRQGYLLLIQGNSARELPFWNLKALPHEETYDQTVRHVRGLLTDVVARQIETEAPLCSFLSGGIDSSLVSSLCALELQKKNRQLATFSFDFEDNERNFKANDFQPSLDAPYVQKMVRYLNSDHQILICTTTQQTEGLLDSILAHDLPNMADVDSSLIYFCSKVAMNYGVAMTGECADEIFAGYPWYHREESLLQRTFPWTKDLNARKVLLSEELIHILHMEEYVSAHYEASVQEAPLLAGESMENKRRRQLSYLNLRWFMQTLLNRMDRAGAYSGLNARVPFADKRMVEYLYNVPWEMKAPHGQVKGLLRDASKGLLPEEIRLRRKSPYPKTYDLGYEQLLADKIREMLKDPSAPVMDFIDPKKMERFLSSPSDYGKPWYGQLMAAPQMLAYLWQINEWMKKWKIKIRI